VHFDNEVHLGKMDKKVHLAKMDRPYVGIRKNHTDKIKMDKKVHLSKMDFFVHFFKVGLFERALVIDSVMLSFFFHAHRSRPPPNTPQHTTIIPHCPHATKDNQELGASR
jgi:hypothetical protein